MNDPANIICEITSNSKRGDIVCRKWRNAKA